MESPHPIQRICVPLPVAYWPFNATNAIVEKAVIISKTHYFRWIGTVKFFSLTENLETRTCERLTMPLTGLPSDF
jgi:hypothetical protein